MIDHVRKKALPEEALDLGIRTAYRVAHRMLRAYWALRNPETRGALVAVWNRGDLLLVKNSYRRHYTLPGGYIRPGETAEQAGARELQEETGIVVAVPSIKEVYAATKPFEHRRDNVTIVEVEIDDRPVVEVDNREVVWAGFKAPRDVLTLPIVPHLREYLVSRG